MWFKISGIKDNKPTYMYYNNITNELKDEYRTTLKFDEVQVINDKVYPFTPNDNPIRRKKDIKTLEISLGLKCNFKCEYCSQAILHQKGNEATIDQVSKFIDMLKKYNINITQGFQLWGGEPLVYTKILYALIPELKKLYPNAHIGFPTNGSLLTKELVDFFAKYDVAVFVSTDGSLNTDRGTSVELDPKLNEIFRYAADTLGKHFGFNTTPHAGTANAVNIIKFLLSQVPNVKNIGTRNVVRVHYKDLVPEEVFYISDDELEEYSKSIKEVLTTEDLYKYDFSMRRHADMIMFRIASRTDMRTICGECPLTSADDMIVDLYGNIYACHTKNDKGSEIGHLSNLEETPLVGFTHWSNRPNCSKCPYLVSCSGSCSILNDECHRLTCRNVKAVHKGMFNGIFKRWFNLDITSIEPLESIDI